MSKICCISTSFLQDRAEVCRDPKARLGPLQPGWDTPPAAVPGLA